MFNSITYLIFEDKFQLVWSTKILLSHVHIVQLKEVLRKPFAKKANCQAASSRFVEISLQLFSSLQAEQSCMTQAITNHADNGDDANVKGSHRPDSCGQTRDRQIQPTISKFSSPSPFDDCDDNGGFVLWVILIQFLFHIAPE